MPAEPDSAGIVCLSWAATYLVHSTALVAAVWLFLKLHRKVGHAFREILWKTALVGGVLTASCQMLLIPGQRIGDLSFTLERPSASPAAAPEGGPQALIARDERSRAPSESIEGPSQDDQSELDAHEIWVLTDAGPAGDPPASDRLPPVENKTRLAAANAGGVRRSGAGVLLIATLLALSIPICLGCFNCLRQTLSLRSRLAACSVVTEGLPRQILDELRLSIPRAPEVVLLAAPGDAEPSAFGLHRWTIILPERAVSDLSPDELRALLAHELAHLARGDALWLACSRLACSLFAFQPLNHLARREWQRAAEFLCDNWAVSRTGAPLALARCLATVAEWRVVPRATAASLAATGRSGLVDRIERLLDARPRSESWNDWRARPAGLLLTAALLIGLIAAAPRVQLVWAAAPVNARAGAELKTGVAAGVAAAPDVLPSSGLSAESSAVPEDVSSTAAAGPVPSAESALVIRGLLASLDRELEALEAELDDLQPLLRKTGDARVIATATRLRREIGKLRERREALRRIWPESTRP